MHGSLIHCDLTPGQTPANPAAGSSGHVASTSQGHRAGNPGKYTTTRRCSVMTTSKPGADIRRTQEPTRTLFFCKQISVDHGHGPRVTCGRSWLRGQSCNRVPKGLKYLLSGPSPRTSAHPDRNHGGVADHEERREADGGREISNTGFYEIHAVSSDQADIISKVTEPGNLVGETYAIPDLTPPGLPLPACPAVPDSY